MIAIEHIGSTAITGVVAKPIDDIKIGVTSLDIARKLNVFGTVHLIYRHIRAIFYSAIESLSVKSFNKSMPKELYSEKLLAGGKVYFFDVHQTAGGHTYVHIKEKKRYQEHETEHEIVVFADHINEFIDRLASVKNHIEVEIESD